MDIKNAIIESATITSGDHGVLSAWISVNYGGEVQSFGGWALYIPSTYKHHNIQGTAGHFIWRVMEVADVTSWDGLKGKTVRVKADRSKIHAIGHIVQDDWFNPSDDFANI